MSNKIQAVDELGRLLKERKPRKPVDLAPQLILIERILKQLPNNQGAAAIAAKLGVNTRKDMKPYRRTFYRTYSIFEAYVTGLRLAPKDLDGIRSQILVELIPVAEDKMKRADNDGEKKRAGLKLLKYCRNEKNTTVDAKGWASRILKGRKGIDHGELQYKLMRRIGRSLRKRNEEILNEINDGYNNVLISLSPQEANSLGKKISSSLGPREGSIAFQTVDGGYALLVPMDWKRLSGSQTRKYYHGAGSSLSAALEALLRSMSSDSRQKRSKA